VYTAASERRLGDGEVAEPDSMQFQRDLAGRGAFRLLRGGVVVRIA
jgi:hypothetical protein